MTDDQVREMMVRSGAEALGTYEPTERMLLSASMTLALRCALGVIGEATDEAERMQLRALASHAILELYNQIKEPAGTVQ